MLTVCIVILKGEVFANKSDPDPMVFPLWEGMPNIDFTSEPQDSSEQLLLETHSFHEDLNDFALNEHEIIPTQEVIIQLEEATAQPAATAVVAPPTATPEPPPPTPDGTVLLEPWQQFIDGYRDAGGNPAWESIFICVGSHEGGYWIGYHGGNGYWTRFQFSNGDTWPKVVAYLLSIGVEPNPDEPYIVGLAVGWWSSIVDPSGIGGWYHTWRLCT